MANPTRLSWRHDGRNTDGTPFTAEQFAGWEIEVNDIPAAGVPAGWETDGEYEVPLANFAMVQETGTYRVRMRVVNRAGQGSAWSEPVTFTMDFRVPTAPTGLSVG